MDIEHKAAIIAEATENAMLRDHVKTMMVAQKQRATSTTKENKKFSNVDAKKTTQIAHSHDPLTGQQFKANMNSPCPFTTRSPQNPITGVSASYSTFSNLFACSNSPCQSGPKLDFVSSTPFRPLIANPYNSAAAAAYLQQSFKSNC